MCVFVCVQVEGVAEQELQSLHDTVYDQALVWVNSLKTEQKERIEGHFGPMPGKDTEIQVNTHTIFFYIKITKSRLVLRFVEVCT